MPKDKKKKKGKAGGKPALSGKVTRRLRNLSANPLVADVVAATLVAAAAALKDTKRARQLAVEAGDELEQLSKRGVERGNALWKLALDVGRKSAEALIGEGGGKTKKAKTSKAKPAGTAKPKGKKVKSPAGKTVGKSARRTTRPKPGTEKSKPGTEK